MISKSICFLDCFARIIFVHLTATNTSVIIEKTSQPFVWNFTKTAEQLSFVPNKKTSTSVGKRIRYDYSQISRPKVLFPRKRTEKTAGLTYHELHFDIECPYKFQFSQRKPSVGGIVVNTERSLLSLCEKQAIFWALILITLTILSHVT